jgi:phosphoglucomutase
MTTIKFGTDGWRARIAEDYTFDNVRRCTQGFADFLKEEGRADQGMVIGYDQRFQAEEFAASAAEVMAANNIHVWLTNNNTPTPRPSLIRWWTKRPVAQSTSQPVIIHPLTLGSRFEIPKEARFLPMI